MINAYVYPLSNHYLNNILFSDRSKQSVWCYLKDVFLANDISLDTIDLYDHNKNNDNVFIAFNHPNGLDRSVAALMKNCQFDRKFLFQLEPPVVTPWAYLNLRNLRKTYDEIYLCCDVKGYGHFNFPQYYDSAIGEYQEAGDRKFLSIINSNKKPRWISGELYSERIRAIAYFGKHSEIDLYGTGWEKRPFFPRGRYHRDIQKVNRGQAMPKYPTLGKYRYAICFENMKINGYITEKIFDCFFVGTIPVYLGAPDIGSYIPEDCFIDMRDFKSYGELDSYLKSLSDEDVGKFRQSALDFLKSEKYRRFSKEHFAKLLLDLTLKK